MAEMNSFNYCLGCFNIKSEGETVCKVCGYVEGRKPESSTDLLPGTKLNDRYIVGKQIGHGGFGITYLAFDMEDNKKVAIKEYFPDGLVTRAQGELKVQVYSEEGKESYLAGIKKNLEEAKTISKFKDNPNIINVLSSFSENETAYIVMEYIDGINLKQYLKQNGGTMSVGETLKTLLPIIDALDEVHQSGVLHRDISPDNIYITKDNVVKLLDFGAARQVFGEKSKSLSVILKPGFAPEEQYRRKGIQGPWTDIYALGATVYYSLTGQLLPDALDRLRNDDETKKPSDFGVKISPDFENIIMKSVSPNAEDRYQKVKDFRNALIATAISDGSFTTNVKPSKKKFVNLFRQPAVKIGAIAVAVVIIITSTLSVVSLNNTGSVFGIFRGNQLVDTKNDVVASSSDKSTNLPSPTLSLESSSSAVSSISSSVESSSTAPSNAPTAAPTADPTAAPIVAPTADPTAAPIVAPTVAPTTAPTAAPTVAPTAAPKITKLDRATGMIMGLNLEYNSQIGANCFNLFWDYCDSDSVRVNSPPPRQSDLFTSVKVEVYTGKIVFLNSLDISPENQRLLKTYNFGPSDVLLPGNCGGQINNIPLSEIRALIHDDEYNGGLYGQADLTFRVWINTREQGTFHSNSPWGINKS